MTTFYGLSASGVSSLFSSLGNGGSNTTSLLSDYASIKNGSYHKLLKAYYSQTSDSEKTTASTLVKKRNVDNTDWKEAASDISSLKSSAGSLIKGEYTEENRFSLEKEISSFVKNYNAVLDSSADVNSTSLSKKTEWMTRISSNNSASLEKVGITVNSDKTLSLDSDTLSKASLEDLESVFSGSYSYAGQVNSAANLMAQVASRGGASSTAALYTSSGAYSNLSVSSMYNMFL